MSGVEPYEAILFYDTIEEIGLNWWFPRNNGRVILNKTKLEKG